MSRPPKVPDPYPDSDELVGKIEEATNGIDFGPEFVNGVLTFFLEHERRLFSGQTTFFVLGSYKPYPIRRLHFAADELNGRPMTYAFVLCDLLEPEELTKAREDAPATHCKFYLLASYSDYLVAIFEGRHAGPSVELGEIRSSFFDKAHTFRRDYENLEEEDVQTEAVDLSNPYSQPQEDLFVLFDAEGRFYEWEGRADLAREVHSLPEK